MVAKSDRWVDLKGLACSLAAVDVVLLSDDDLAVMVVEGEMLLNSTHSFSAVLLAEFERRRSWQSEGALSGSGWVAARTTTAKSSLQGRAGQGEMLRRLPSATGPAREGRLSPDHLRDLAACARGHLVLAERDEELLVAQAVEFEARAFRAVVRHWQDRAGDVDSPDPAGLADPDGPATGPDGPTGGPATQIRPTCR